MSGRLPPVGRPLIDSGRAADALIRISLVVCALLSAPRSSASAAIRIVALGDSATAGYLVPRAQAYPEQLQRLLRAKGYDVVVENAGINGGTLAGALRRFDLAIAPGTRIALVEFGTNDLRAGASMKTVRLRLTEMIRSLQARRIEVLVIGLGRLNLADVAKTNGALYAQWTLPKGKYRARDGAHFNARGYAILVQRLLPQVEALIARVAPRR